MAVLLYHILGLLGLVFVMLGITKLINLFEDYKGFNKKIDDTPLLSKEELERVKLIKNREDKINKILR